MSRYGMPDKISGDEYVLHMDAETAQVVAHACELYARIRFGQFQEVGYLTIRPQCTGDKTFGDRIKTCREMLEKARAAAFPELENPGHSYGVGKFRDADAAWNAYQAIRYIKAWHENPGGGVTVNFNEPMRVSDAPMPICEVRNGDLDWHECFIDKQTGRLVDTDTGYEELKKRRGDRS